MPFVVDAKIRCIEARNEAAFAIGDGNRKNDETDFSGYSITLGGVWRGQKRGTPMKPCADEQERRHRQSFRVWMRFHFHLVFEIIAVSLALLIDLVAFRMLRNAAKPNTSTEPRRAPLP